jgi:hypothetical protein
MRGLHFFANENHCCIWNRISGKWTLPYKVNGESAYVSGFGVLAECYEVSGLIVRTVAPPGGTPIEHWALFQEKFGCLDFQGLKAKACNSIGWWPQRLWWGRIFWLKASMMGGSGPWPGFICILVLALKWKPNRVTENISYGSQVVSDGQSWVACWDFVGCSC